MSSDFIHVFNNVDNKVDYLIEIININNDFVFENLIEEEFKKYKFKIIDEIIDNDFIELIPKIKKIFKSNKYKSDKNISNNIIKSLKKKLHRLDLKSIEWFIKNEKEIFKKALEVINLSDFMEIIISEKNFQITNSIKTDKDILNIYENKIISLITTLYISMFTVKRISRKESQLYSNLDNFILIINIYLKKKNLYKSEIEAIHSKIIFSMLKNNCSFENIIRYKKTFQISEPLLKEYFEKNFILEGFLKYSSIENVKWFFELASVLVVIKHSNYKRILTLACLSGNIEVIKLIHNLIECAGFKIDEITYQSTIRNLISEERFNNNIKKNYYENIIYEIINMGINPKCGKSKYNDYYKNMILNYKN
jgi:hypothetical protein